MRSAHKGERPDLRAASSARLAAESPRYPWQRDACPRFRSIVLSFSQSADLTPGLYGLSTRFATAPLDIEFSARVQEHAGRRATESCTILHRTGRGPRASVSCRNLDSIAVEVHPPLVRTEPLARANVT